MGKIWRSEEEDGHVSWVMTSHLDTPFVGIRERQEQRKERKHGTELRERKREQVPGNT